MRKYPKYLSDFISEHSSEYSIPDMAKEILHSLLNLSAKKKEPCH